MSEGEKLKAVKLIQRIQHDGGRREDFEELERVTGDSTFWYAFDEVELSGLLPEEILDLFCGHYLSIIHHPQIPVIGSQRISTR